MGGICWGNCCCSGDSSSSGAIRGWEMDCEGLSFSTVELWVNTSLASLAVREREVVRDFDSGEEDEEEEDEDEDEDEEELGVGRLPLVVVELPRRLFRLLLVVVAVEVLLVVLAAASSSSAVFDRLRRVAIFDTGGFD